MSQSRRRAGLAECTPNMLAVMQMLCKQQDNDGYLFVDVDCDPRTTRALLKRDWITISHPKNNQSDAQYRLTKRGEKAVHIYGAPTDDYDQRRFDGICPECNVNPRGWYETGSRRPYCKECDNALKRRVAKLRNGVKKPGICPDCGERQKHITASGRVRSYCLPCRRKRSKLTRAKSARRNLERVQRGEILLCYRCKTEPRLVTGQTVQDYCKDCFYEYHRERRRL